MGGQIAIAAADIARIPQIVTQYDAIETNVPIKDGSSASWRVSFPSRARSVRR
jgi:hypothetical protein